MNWLRTLLSMMLLMACAETVHGQQLLIIKKGHVSSRFNPGDDIFFELKDQRKVVHHAVLGDIREFYFTTTVGDSITYARVDRIIFRNNERKRYGLYTVAGGLGLLAVYGLNSLAFDTNSQSMRGMATVGVLGVAFGLLIYFTSENTTRLRGGTRLKFAAYDSPLYR